MQLTPLAENRRKAWEFYSTIAFKAADELRNAIGLDETAFQRIAPFVHQDPRNVYIYRILDEV